jgi:hypothetical protein
MKRIGHLYERAFTPSALLAAFHLAARHKHGKRACFKFETHLASNLDALHQELADGSYRADQVIPVAVTFSEPVTVTGTPQLVLHLADG